MKKKQWCLFKRFAALVAALVICFSLCVPAFASNNAQWRKWVITAERNLTNESGTSSRYFQLTPFQNGEIYAAVFQSFGGQFHYNVSKPSGYGWIPDIWYINCVNYPDWWRSAIPLGFSSYLQFDVKSLTYGSSLNPSSPSISSSATLYIFDSNYSLDFSLTVPESSTSSAVTPGSISSSAPSSVFLFQSARGVNENEPFLQASSMRIASGQSYMINLSSWSNISLGFPLINFTTNGVSFAPAYLANLSSDRLVVGVLANENFRAYTTMTAELSFWVDANKLPAGLKVGDEFPADTDAFDQLRDELLDQFPEAADNIENGKTTIQGWNDTETVDTDVASTSISALNAMFQNLGGFLFIVSLMVFGAVVLRMLIRKAVDG